MSITLRGYQETQLEFIDRNINVTNVIGLESGTGSGKTVVFLEFTKNWLKKKDNLLSSVVVSTGFNHLVFDLEKRAAQHSLESIVLIGRGRANCPILVEASGDLSLKGRVFTETGDDYICGDSHKTMIPIGNGKFVYECAARYAAYRAHVESVADSTGKLIITNHSSFLVYQQLLSKASLVIFDEAHTFANFYDSYRNIELDHNDMLKIHTALEATDPVMRAVIKKNINNGVFPLPAKQLKTILECIKEENFSKTVESFFTTKPGLGNYVEASAAGIKVNRFYKFFEFDVLPKVVLASATLDSLTVRMFGGANNYIYREKQQFCDYKNSEFIAIPDDEFNNSLESFLDYVESHGKTSGLILSTTMVDVNKTMGYDGTHDFKMFRDREEFQRYEGKKILVGSRSLFQGIDIPGLQFVALNKLPFPLYGDVAEARNKFLTDGGKNRFDPWSDYTVPIVENDIIQSTGRLWRNSESAGIIAIFDSRIKRFKYLIKKSVRETRPGIKISIMQSGEVKPFEI